MSQQSKMLECINCGGEINILAQFCEYCGTRLRRFFSSTLTKDTGDDFDD